MSFLFSRSGILTLVIALAMLNYTDALIAWSTWDACKEAGLTPTRLPNEPPIPFGRLIEVDCPWGGGGGGVVVKEVPGPTRTVEVPGATVYVDREVVREVEVPGPTVYVEVPGPTVTVIVRPEDAPGGNL